MPAVEVHNVSKSYSLAFGSYGTLRDDFAHFFSRLSSNGRSASGKASTRTLRALRNVSFQIEQGEAVGIIGPNGAGKTTMLKLLARVTTPTEGNISIRGKVAPLIELGAGFHPELTGRENIYLNASIMGMRRGDIHRKIDSIVDFANLAAHLDTPVKKYSSGMYARLGFAVAIHLEPEVLLVDEVLAVGDWAFQQKCLKRMDEFRRKGTTIIFVSHNMEGVRWLCSRVLVFDRGTLDFDGLKEEGIARYYQALSRSQVTVGHGSDAKLAEIQGLEVLNSSGVPARRFDSGETAIIRYSVVFNEDIEAPDFGFFVHRPDHIQIISTGARDLGVALETGKKGTTVQVEFRVKMNVLAGIYRIGAEVRDREFKNYFDFLPWPISVVVEEHYSHGGIAHLDPVCRVNESSDV